MALPMTLIIISGEIDLSVASILGMTSALLGILWNDHWPMLAIFPVLLVAGAAAGLINGLLVTRAGLPSLAVTIGTLALYRGIAVILLGSNSVSTFPSPYATIGVLPVPHLGSIPWNIAIFIVLAVLFGFVLHVTPLGRSIFAMGNNAETALFSGIRVKRIKTGLFVVSGMVCAVAGALWTFRLSTAVQSNGLGAELNVVAIVLLGRGLDLRRQGLDPRRRARLRRLRAAAERPAAHAFQPGGLWHRRRRAAAHQRLRAAVRRADGQDPQALYSVPPHPPRPPSPLTPLLVRSRTSHRTYFSFNPD